MWATNCALRTLIDAVLKQYERRWASSALLRVLLLRAARE